MNRIISQFRSLSARNLVLAAALPAMMAGAAFAQSSPKYPAWVEGSTYQTGTIVSYQGYDYKALVYQTDWVGAGWNPAASTSLWTKLGVDGTVPTPTPTPVVTVDPPVTLGPTCNPVWAANTAYLGGAAVSFNGINYKANWWTQGNEPDTNNGASGTGKPWTIAAGCNTPTPDPGPVTPPTPTPTPTPDPTPTPSTYPNDGSTGIVNFHLLLGAGSPQDSLDLAGGRYTDLIQSNIIAGVMMGHLIQEDYPTMTFNKDYLYGSILGQLLQENLETQVYVPSTNLIDPLSDQAAVMGMGQGGPYQINNYAADMVSGSYAPGGHSLINYVALQNSIGYTFATAEGQHLLNTPVSFNDKYFGPLLTSYFHYNDFVALVVTGKGDGGWKTPWQPAYDNALTNFSNLPGSFLDVLLNAAYNQGYYGPLVSQYSVLGATATPATVAAVDDFASIWGSPDSYVQYPYQVRYYLNQMYDLPIPTTTPKNLTTPQNVVNFKIAALQTVFTNVYTKLSYKGSNGHLAVITATQAQTAFNTALTRLGIANTATLALSNTSDRALIFTLLEQAISNLETATGMPFNATSTTQI